MAIAKFGAIVTDVRGKLGGHVFQGNGFTTSLRTMSTTKGYIGQFNASTLTELRIVRINWEALTVAEKNQWGVLASQFLVPNKFGDYVQLSAFNLFVRNTLALAYANAPNVIDPFGASNVVISPALLSVEIDFPGGEITINTSSVPGAYGINVYALPVNSLNQRIYPKKLIWFRGAPSNPIVPSVLFTALLAKFPFLENNTPIQFGVVFFNEWGFYTFKKTAYATYV